MLSVQYEIEDYQKRTSKYINNGKKNSYNNYAVVVMQYCIERSYSPFTNLGF